MPWPNKIPTSRCFITSCHRSSWTHSSWSMSRINRLTSRRRNCSTHQCCTSISTSGTIGRRNNHKSLGPTDSPSRRRCRTFDSDGKSVIINNFNLTAQGTRYSDEFADFLKEILGYIPRDGEICGTTVDGRRVKTGKEL